MKNIFEAYKNRKRPSFMNKPVHYLEAYDFHFSRLNSVHSLLEIGVAGGGSLYTWKEYFPNASIYGIDCLEATKQHECDRVKVFVGNQADINFLSDVINTTGKLDIVIDDGSHICNDQFTSFDYLFSYLNDGGVYVIEDTGTSYWPHFGGGYGKDNFIGYLRSLAEVPSLWAARDEESKVIQKVPRNHYEQKISSIHFYDNICFIYKKGHGFNENTTVRTIKMISDE